MTEHARYLDLHLGATDAEAEEIAFLTTQLREQLLELDVHRVDVVAAGKAPSGARAGELAAAGALLVSVGGHVGALRMVVDTVRAWLSRIGPLGPRSIKLAMDGDVLEVTGASSRQQQELIQVWLTRHGAGMQRAATPTEMREVVADEHR